MKRSHRHFGRDFNSPTIQSKVYPMTQPDPQRNPFQTIPSSVDSVIDAPDGLFQLLSEELVRASCLESRAGAGRHDCEIKVSISISLTSSECTLPDSG